jgi:hypothetical protein
MSEKTGAAKANVKAKLKSLSTRWFDFAAKVVEFIDKSVEPALKRFFKGLVTFYKNRVHPILAMTASPEKRAIAAGRYLCRLAVTYAILSIIGAIILAFITEEGKECVDSGIFTDTCYEYATVHPYIEWAILSLFSALILSSFLYAFGSYVEARMKKQLESSSI